MSKLRVASAGHWLRQRELHKCLTTLPAGTYNLSPKTLLARKYLLMSDLSPRVRSQPPHSSVSAPGTNSAYPRALKSPRISPPQGSAGGPNSGGEAGAGAGGQGLWGWALSPRRSGGWPGGGVPRILWGEHAPASGARAAVRVGAPAATSLPALSLCPAPGQRGRRRGPAGMPASRGAERARRKDSREGGWGGPTRVGGTEEPWQAA